jgi:hypothetical protein
VFALYVMGYTAGRFWIETMRSDKANHILGMRVNNWVSILVFLGGLAWFVRHRDTARSTAVTTEPSAELGDPERQPDKAPDLDSSHDEPPDTGREADESATATDEADKADKAEH